MTNAMLVFLFVVPMALAGTKVDDVTFPETVQVFGQTLHLNGAGMRKVRRFGFHFSVYAAGLYLVAHNSDGAAILKSTTPKYLKMVFVRGVERDQLVASWTKSFKLSCKTDCKKDQQGLSEFNGLMSDVQDGSSIEMTFTKDGVKVAVNAHDTKATMIKNPGFAKDLLGIFVGGLPEVADLQAKLLGPKPTPTSAPSRN